MAIHFAVRYYKFHAKKYFSDNKNFILPINTNIKDFQNKILSTIWEILKKKQTFAQYVAVKNNNFQKSAKCANSKIQAILLPVYMNQGAVWE